MKDAPSDLVSSVDWNVVPRDAIVEACSSATRARRLSDAFHAMTYVLICATMFIVFALKADQLAWGVVGIAAAVVATTRLGVRARRARQDRDGTFASLARTYPSKET